MINKICYDEGQISVMRGGTWAYLLDVQDTLLAKIKPTGQEGLSIPEQSSTDLFATDAGQSKLEHPTTNVFKKLSFSVYFDDLFSVNQGPVGIKFLAVRGLQYIDQLRCNIKSKIIKQIGGL